MPSPPDADLPQQSSSSVHQPFPRSNTTQGFCQILAELVRLRAPPMMLNLRSNAAHRNTAVAAPQGGDDLHADDGTNVGDDAFGGGGRGFGAVPTSGVAIAGLPEKLVGESEVREKAECAVCLEAYAVGDKMRTMPCTHGFHEGCIFRWLRVSRLCPLCRFELPAETEAEFDMGDEEYLLQSQFVALYL